MKDLISSALLETFVEVARAGSVSKAARQLHRSQPAISQRLQQLEGELGVALFRPAGRGIALTREGEVLLSDVRTILTSLRELPTRARPEALEARGPLRIGTLPTMARYLLADAIETVLVDAPEVQLRVEMGLESDLVAKLNDGWLDAMFFIGDVDTWGLTAQRLGDVHIRVAAPPGWFGARPRPGDLRKRRLLLWRGAADPSFALIERHARSLGLVTPTTPEIAHIETLKTLVERQAGYALLPDYVLGPEVARQTIAVSVLPGFDTTFPIHVYFREHRTQTLATKQLLDRVHETIGRHLPEIGSHRKKTSPR